VSKVQHCCSSSFFLPFPSVWVIGDQPIYCRCCIMQMIACFNVSPCFSPFCLGKTCGFKNFPFRNAHASLADLLLRNRNSLLLIQDLSRQRDSFAKSVRANSMCSSLLNPH
jgi:hypothetical protein